jgi:hypothetical protein
MAQQIYITYTDNLSAIADAIGANLYIAKKIKIANYLISAEELKQMAIASLTEYFYVINSDTEIRLTDFIFSFKPPAWDGKYLHIWDKNSRVRLYNRGMVLANPEYYSDNNLINGNVSLKMRHDKMFDYPLTDIVFLSYDEERADANFDKLVKRFPYAKRMHGVSGILEAHFAAAGIAETKMFYVVDADAIIEPEFDFGYRPDGFNQSFVHVWHSRNPVNDLVYGYGGVKLFPTSALLKYTGSPVDITTSISNGLKIMPEISNVTQFNTDPFSAWRSGFRECTKLASKLIPNHNNIETEERLDVWCTKGKDREFGEFAILGANEGMLFGKTYKDQPDKLALINDYKWLENKFSN